MDPNQPVPTPIQPEIPPQPITPPIEPTMQPVLPPNPTLQQANPNSFQPFQPIGAPVQPSVEPQPVLQSELTGTQVQQPFAQPLDSTIIYQPKKSKAKLFIVIGIVLLALAGVGVAVWIMLFNGIKLTEYSNTSYSILVPSSYKKSEFGTTVDFEKPDTKSGYGSKMTVVVTPIPSESKDEFIKLLDEQFTEETFSSGNSFVAFQDTTNVKIEKSTKNGMEFRRASGKIIDNKVAAGSFTVAIYISDTNAYTIGITAHSTEPGLNASSSKIIDSFKEK